MLRKEQGKKIPQLFIIHYSLFIILIALTPNLLAAIRAVTPDPYGGNTNCWQMQRHRVKIAEKQGTDAKVVFIGDSITHFWEDRGKVAWQRYFAKGPMKALNLGTSADRTEHVLWRITEGGELDGYEAKCILLMIGTNNSGHFPFEKEPPIDTIEGVRKLLKAIAEKQPKARIILTAIFPRGATNDDPWRKRNDVVNKELSGFADGKRVIWCDFSDKFLDAQGRLSPEIFPDRLHPNLRGYEIWASSVVPLIAKVLAAKEGEYIPSVWPSNPRIYSQETAEPLRPCTAYGVIPWWNKGVVLNQRNEIVDNASGEFDVVWVGDSITHRWYREKGEGQQKWAEISKTYRMLNLGIGGDRTEHVLWRLQNGELEGYRAKMFAVMIGTNNGGRNVPAIAEATKRIVQLIRKRHPESVVVLMPIFPRADRGQEQQLANERINAITKGIADGKMIRWLDFNRKFFNAEGKLTKEVMNDLLHPNERGYEIWAENILPIVKEVCGK